ncbi:MAG: hypothetical protein QW721_01950, partial [Desulfurococcaceae archaeon]
IMDVAIPSEEGIAGGREMDIPGGATPYGLILYLVLTLLLFAFLTKVKAFGSGTGRVVAFAISIAICFLFIGPIAANILQQFVPVQLVEQGGPIEIAPEEGALKITVIDALAGSPISSGKIYLLRGSYDVTALDQIKKGGLKAGSDYLVLSLSSSGEVTFQGVTGSAIGTQYTVIYEPSSLSNTGYPVTAQKVVAYRVTENGLLRASGSTLNLYKMSGAAIFDPTSTTRGSYTVNTLSFDLAARLGPTAPSSAIANVYVYTNRSDTITSLSIYLAGNELSFQKISNLEAENPLVKNAPAGATYVCTSPLTGPIVYDDKIDIRIKGEATGNTTLTLFFVNNANIKEGDVLLGTFKIVVNTQGTPGWGS